MRLLGLNQLSDGAVHHHDFDDSAAAAAVRCLDEVLRDDGVQAVREEALGLLALVAGQRVDDAVDRLHRARRMQRAQHQVARFRGRHRHADRLSIAQLADEDNVGVFAQACADALGEARNVRAEFALDDLAAFAAVDELDRVLEADDVRVTRRVDVIDHRGESRGLARARRARHEHHALMQVAELVQDRRQPEAIQARYDARDVPKRRADAGRLVKNVHAEPPAVAAYVREVDILPAAKPLALRIA